MKSWRTGHVSTSNGDFPARNAFAAGRPIMHWIGNLQRASGSALSASRNVSSRELVLIRVPCRSMTSGQLSDSLIMERSNVHRQSFWDQVDDVRSLAFDPFPLPQDYLSASKVDVGRSGGGYSRPRRPRSDFQIALACSSSPAECGCSASGCQHSVLLCVIRLYGPADGAMSWWSSHLLGRPRGNCGAVVGQPIGALVPSLSPAFVQNGSLILPNSISVCNRRRRGYPTAGRQNRRGRAKTRNWLIACS